jgi:hypothetical protein
MTRAVDVPPWPGPRIRVAPGLMAGALGCLLLAGCGGGSTSRTVASLPGHRQGAGVPSARLTAAQSDRDMVAFARCMRTHGVEMSDPFHRPGHSGLSIDLPPQDAATRAAYAACNQSIQPIVQSKEQHARPDPPAVLAALTRYAQCMRAQDIGMLDPTAAGALSLGQVGGITNDFGRYSPQFRAADAACRHLLPAGVHDDGTGP